MFNKKLKEELVYLKRKLTITESVLVEVEADLREAKHAAKHFKEKWREVEHENDKLKKRRKKK